MPNRIFAAQVVRAVEATPIVDAELFIFENGTTTQKTVYAADGETVLNQPLVSYSDGTFRAFYTLDNLPVTVLIRDEDGNPLPGYPVDDVYPDSAAGASASGVSFSPIETVPETEVQSAIERVAALATAESTGLAFANTFWTTGGTVPAYRVTPSPALTAYAIGTTLTIVPHASSPSSGATINVNGLGARQLRKFTRDGTTVAIASGDIQRGIPVQIVYDGTNFIVAVPIERVAVTEGRYFKSTSGLLICFNTALTLSHSSIHSLTATWTFPYAFALRPHVSVTLPTSGEVGTYTGIDPIHVGHTGYSDGTTSTVVFARRVYGAPEFEPGDSITNVSVIATGVWF